ncbi:TORTIFOLIA1-like protein 2 [Cannabis sativa]|uniref:TORTIFOLIA1-like protein 2 n=1 Tax=Cannabis sativa TaxID=3483 RepID=UPI0029CA9AD1|nr:TORTIFOLIA1-like protein 2 [Cannabis sativa]
MKKGSSSSNGGNRRNAQQVLFDLKHRVVVALNKVGDRDTYQLGVDELEKTAHSLTPDGIFPFLSCILDTDSEHKISVRKECVRLMGSLLRYHPPQLISPHLPKMVNTLLKRLKDPDSVVRDACVQTVALMASKFSDIDSDGDGDVDGRLFVTLVRPLFEALGEQNRQVQCGSALCLAAVIDNTHNPPVSLLHRMLLRTTKLLKNPHFMAKPSIIELNRSIILAGGAPTQNILVSAMGSIQESLKSNDWSTRKAASLALAEIASSGASFLGSLKPSCVRSLESCRFDKVKPVRDTVLHALQCWKTLPGSHTPQPSETGSSIKENYCGDEYSDLTSGGELGWKDVAPKKVNSSGSSSTKARIPLSIRKKCNQTYVQNSLKSNSNNNDDDDDDWRIEIAVPKTTTHQQHNLSLADLNNEESEGSSVTKNYERLSTDVTSLQDIGYEYVHMDDKQEECSSSISNVLSHDFETKIVKVCHEGGGLPKAKATERDQKFAPESNCCDEEQMYPIPTKIRDRASLDSTVTESAPSSHCCLQMVNEMNCIRNQLVQIEDKQSSLMDLLQVFSTGIMDSLSMLQSRVVGLEDVVDRLAQNIVQREREELSNLTTSKLIKQSHVLHSPRLSTSCTPRPSVDSQSRQPSLLSAKSNENWGENVFESNLRNTSTKRGTEMRANSTKVNFSRNPTGMDTQRCLRQGTGRMGYGQVRSDPIFGPTSSITSRRTGLENKNSLWKRVKGLLCEGDLESAYEEALSSRDEQIVMELFDITGPVLECLSSKMVSDVLSTLGSFLQEQKFTTTLVPWLQQVVDLSTVHGPNYLMSTVKARQKLLSAVQEALRMEFSNPLEKRSMNQVAAKLHHVWGKCS